jgi:DNA replication and repair protein RecF
MFIQRLLVERVRNLQQVSLNELALLNFFIGENGSGKTSLLEAIAIAAQGRSFRHHKIQTVITEQADSLQVFLQCQADDGVLHKLGVQRDKDNAYVIRINEESVYSLAELSSTLPVLVLDANAFELLDGSPTQRCKFIDWSVFHLEPSFYTIWSRFNRVLKQRNSLLKTAKSYNELAPWDSEFCRLAIEIERMRLAFLQKFQPELAQVLTELDSHLLSSTIYYANGWRSDKIAFLELEQANDHISTEQALMQQLQQSFERDSRYQRTHLGPQRADLQIRTGNHNDVRDIYSRGQKKSLIAAMKLAQALVVNRLQNKRAVLLLDDLPSELDEKHLQRFIDFILKNQLQSFITTVDANFCKDIKTQSRLFSVERGRIAPFTLDESLGEKNE